MHIKSLMCVDTCLAGDKVREETCFLQSKKGRRDWENKFMAKFMQATFQVGKNVFCHNWVKVFCCVSISFNVLLFVVLK